MCTFASAQPAIYSRPLPPPVRGNAITSLSGWAGNWVPRDFLHLKSPNLWSGWPLEEQGDSWGVTRTGRKAREGGAPDEGSFLVSSARRLLFHYRSREGEPAGPSARRVSCLIASPLPCGFAVFLNHTSRPTVPRRVGTRCAGVGAPVRRNRGWMSPPGVQETCSRM